MDLWEMGVIELARLLRSRETSSREVLASLHARSDVVNPKVNAIVELVPNAVDVAAARDAGPSVDASGSLDGVPVSFKTNIDIAGLATTSGAASLRMAIAPTDAPVVDHVRRAGAIPFARTNMAEFGFRNHTSSSLYGRTRNPWDADRTAGGSSGGEAVAVATGLSPVGFGNDVAGSIRNPAHCCGVVGLKPSTGLIPHASFDLAQAPPLSYQLMLGQGIIARRVADAEFVLRSAIGPHERDPLALPVTLDALTPPGRQLRIAVALDPPTGRSASSIRSAIERAAQVLAEENHIVEEVAPPGYERTPSLTWEMLMADFRDARQGLLPLLGSEAATMVEHMIVLLGDSAARPVSELYVERHLAEIAWHHFFAAWDAMLTPVSPSVATVHGADISSVDGTAESMAGLAPLLPGNLFGLPAVAVPVAIADGLPIAVQVLSRRFADSVALRVAQIIEDHVGSFTPIDPIIARSEPGDVTTSRLHHDTDDHRSK
jgi:amidase